MRIFSYVMARDYGFAPNPFNGVCTLSTCKPAIRKNAEIGDWVIGTGSKKFNLHNNLMFAMKVSEKLTFDEYWISDRFQIKKANLRGSLKQAFGDNIYHSENGTWLQTPSHHSQPDGTPNQGNIIKDTSSPLVLIASEFTYWGKDAPLIPDYFRNSEGPSLVKVGPGHKSHFPEEFIHYFIDWYNSFELRGYLSEPIQFRERFR